MRTRLLVACLALVTASTALAGTGADITLRVEPFFDPYWKRDELRFSGTIATRAANEYVTVVGKLCGESYFTAVGGATTTAGGAWQVVPERSVLDGNTPATYQARWNTRVSEEYAGSADYEDLRLRVKKGTRLRASISDAQSAPCYLGNVSAVIRS